MKDIIQKTIHEHKMAVEYFEQNLRDIVLDISEIITKSLSNSGTVYLCGNGGSAADCQHIAGEFVGRFRRERDAFPAVAFSTDTSIITCIGNDYSFEDIFYRQVQALVKKGDVLWAFSTSGNSANVVKAAALAKEKAATVIAFTGRAASQLERIANICLCADTPQTSTAQEVHMLAYHIICDLIEIKYIEGEL